MSEKSKTDQVTELLKAYTTIEDMKAHGIEIAEKVGCARSLVYRCINRLAESLKPEVLPEAKEPIVKIPKAEEAEIPLEEYPEQVEPSEPEIPTPEKLEEEEEIEPDKTQRLTDIFTRSVTRIFDIPIDAFGFDQKILGIQDQDLDDSAFLVAMLIERHFKIEAMTDEWLDLVTGIHFTTFAAKTFVNAYLEWKRRKEEEKKEEIKEEPKSAPSAPSPQPSEPIEEKKKKIKLPKGL